MKTQTSQNLGEGNVGSLFVKLAVPAIVAQLVNMLYNIVDRMYIGHIPGVGRLALTGLGLCFPVIMLISAFSALVGMGGAPQAAICLGRKDRDGAERILGNCTAALVLLAVLLTAVFLLFGRSLLFAFGASADTIDYAWSYLRIYICGTIFVQLSLGLNMFITTQGFTTYSMMTVLIGAGINIVLDPIFIFVLNMGVQGAALATVLSQAVSSIWVLRFLAGGKTRLRLRKRCLKLRPEVLLPVLALGVSPFVMQCTESILNICFNTSLQKYGGDMAVGAMTILSSVMQVCLMPLQGMTQGAQPIISFNYGAGNTARVRKAFKILLITAMSYTTVFWLAVQLFPQFFVMIFNKESAELMDITVWALRIYMGAILVLGAQISCQQTFVALGQAKISLLLACLRKLILLIPLIYILPVFMADQVFAVFLAEPIADALAGIVTVTVFMLNIRKILEGTDRNVQKNN